MPTTIRRPRHPMPRGWDITTGVLALIAFACIFGAMAMLVFEFI